MYNNYSVLKDIILKDNIDNNNKINIKEKYINNQLNIWIIEGFIIALNIGIIRRFILPNFKIIIPNIIDNICIDGLPMLLYCNYKLNKCNVYFKNLYQDKLTNFDNKTDILRNQIELNKAYYTNSQYWH